MSFLNLCFLKDTRINKFDRSQTTKTQESPKQPTNINWFVPCDKSVWKSIYYQEFGAHILREG